jgi:branched-chain amino acid transport system ATP-binding protein
VSPMLHVSALKAQYGRVPALHDVSIDVNQGEIVGVVGPNGAGKTTLLKCITGILKPAGGEIEFRDRSILDLPPETIVRSGISLVPEGRRIFAGMTVGENLRLAATPLRDRRRMTEAIDRELERFPILGEYYDTPASRLSGGEQQQLAIARALLPKPSLLLLDEPSLGLSPLMVDLVFEALESFRVEGMTVLLVELNAARAVELADRSYVLRAGLVTLSGSRDELLHTADFASVYLGV